MAPEQSTYLLINITLFFPDLNTLYFKILSSNWSLQFKVYNFLNNQEPTAKILQSKVY